MNKDMIPEYVKKEVLHFYYNFSRTSFNYNTVCRFGRVEKEDYRFIKMLLQEYVNIGLLETKQDGNVLVYHNVMKIPGYQPIFLRRPAHVITNNKGLTKRETRILELFSFGMDHIDVSEETGIAYSTVSVMLCNIRTKLELSNKANMFVLIQTAVQLGIITQPLIINFKKNVSKIPTQQVKEAV